MRKIFVQVPTAIVCTFAVCYSPESQSKRLPTPIVLLSHSWNFYVHTRAALHLVAPCVYLRRPARPKSCVSVAAVSNCLSRHVGTTPWQYTRVYSKAKPNSKELNGLGVCVCTQRLSSSVYTIKLVNSLLAGVVEESADNC